MTVDTGHSRAIDGMPSIEFPGDKYQLAHIGLFVTCSLQLGAIAIAYNARADQK